ncbi:MORN motif protein (macronuclear) [Tetrahymena thermophila SB210]|uniref:MORN motif protein n=1 Tax=Tetrahymena thermophila (strain SB210) TaxID=312017 RepID=I7MG33_TETTS|nr:MORN motif protein [Tetrahymena thermophila SB210]EAR84829.1 MORN motif protein [Tetrahymena thermophila SB210]|eukprot:XP_001032492.1 MORN motif protein [Tetrahymena thermophila SB210]
MQKPINFFQSKSSNFDISPTPSKDNVKKMQVYEMSERKIPYQSSFLGSSSAFPGSFSNENDISQIQNNNLSMKLMNEEQQKQEQNQKVAAFPKLVEKYVPFEYINYIKIVKFVEPTPFFWNQNINSSTVNQDVWYEIQAKNQFGKILSRKKICTKNNQHLEQQINEISFMKGFRLVQVAHIQTALSQMHNSYKNLKDAYYIQKMDDGEYHGTLSNNNIPNGLGIYYYTDGSIYQGQLQMRKRHQKGYYIMSDGSTYDGSWVEDQMCGEGTLTDSFKNEYRGQFKYGEKQGKGRITYKDGSTMEGTWSNGYEEGEFLLTVGVNYFKLMFEKGVIKSINGVTIDKVPKDSTHYTLIHVQIFPEQIEINEYLKPFKQNKQQAQQPKYQNIDPQAFQVAKQQKEQQSLFNISLDNKSQLQLQNQSSSPYSQKNNFVLQSRQLNQIQKMQNNL